MVSAPPLSRGSAFVRGLELALQQGAEEPRRRVALLNELARTCVVDDARRTQELCHEAQRLAEACGDARGLFQARANEVLALLYFSQLDEARARLSALIETPPVNALEVARCRSLRSMLEQRGGDLSAALSSALSAESCLRGTEWEGSLENALTHNLIGNLLSKLAEPTGAIEHYEEAFAKCAKLGRDDLLAYLTNNVAYAHRELGQHAEAFDAFNLALAHTDPAEPSYRRASILTNLALELIEMGRAQEALEPLVAALPMCEAVGSRRGLAGVHHTFGIAYRALGDLQSAMVHTARAACIRAELGERLDLAESRLQQGLLQRQLGRVEEAVRSLQGVLEGSGSTVWSRLRAAAHFGLYEIRRAQGDLAEALDHHVAFHDASRAVMDDRMMLRRQALSIRLKMRQLELEHERLRSREGELERAATTDALTGLPNRRAVEQRLAVELRRAHAQRRPVSAAVVDIDHFKAINDRFSHAVGDAALREVGWIFQRTLRDGDFVGRFGGEEFVVLFRDASVESAAAACERLRGALLRHPWSECLPALQSAVTASFGVAEAGESRTPEAWLARADAALYRAKRTGRNRVARDDVGDGAAPDAQGD